MHPHLHCLITAGGFAHGEWVSSSKKFLLPFRVVRIVFKGKYLDYLRKALNKGELILPDGMRPQHARNLFKKMGRGKKWNVKLKETYSYGQGVLIYLARYLRGGPISNKRIVRVENGKVTFNYGREKVKLTTLPIEKFIGRYLQHTPLPRTVMVRSYGLYNHNLKSEYEHCRLILGQPVIEEQKFVDWQELWQERNEEHPDRCPVCGKRLVILETLVPVKKVGTPLNCNKDPDIAYDQAA